MTNNQNKTKNIKSISQIHFVCTVGILTLFAFIVLKLIYPQYTSLYYYFLLLIAVFGLIFSLILIGYNLFNIQNNSKLQHSYEITIRLNSKEFMEVRKLIYENLMEGKISHSEVAEFISSSNEREYLVKTILNALEIMSTSIKLGLANEKYLYDVMKDIVKAYFYHTQPYIEYLRKTKESPSLFEELEQLYNNWNARVYLSSNNKIN
jgi:Domain of unknown function (DUF4760)